MPDATTDLINAELSADAAWERTQQLEEINERLTNEVSEHRKRSMRQYYASQGFMAIKALVDKYNAHIGNESSDDAIGRIYATILEHKANIDRADNAGANQGR